MIMMAFRPLNKYVYISLPFFYSLRKKKKVPKIGGLLWDKKTIIYLKSYSIDVFDYSRTTDVRISFSLYSLSNGESLSMKIF